MNLSQTLLTAAVSGIIAGAAVACGGSTTPAASADSPSAEMASAGAKHDCKGKNDCKGQGGCKTEGHSCKGQNACKGQGGCKT